MLTRGLAVRSTWLGALPNVALYTSRNLASAGMPSIGVVPPERRHEVRPGAAAAHLVQLYGLADLARRFPRAKWYYIVGTPGLPRHPARQQASSDVAAAPVRVPSDHRRRRARVVAFGGGRALHSRSAHSTRVSRPWTLVSQAATRT